MELDFGRETRRRTYFAMMLPGRATLTVYGLPLDGLKTAVGLEVSGAVYVGS